ncbi:MAG: hypothetical protein IJS94_04865 [Clostridia bacterium]|nr:hypothetical protein [Clostridia bacterium]
MTESILFELTYSYTKYSGEKKIIRSSFFLGVFSSVEKIEKAIHYYSSVPGFSKDKNRFFIRPVYIRKAAELFQAGIAYIADKAQDDVDEIIGYYDTEETAKNEIVKSCLYENFKDHIVIERITVDKMEWTEGFVEL